MGHEISHPSSLPWYGVRTKSNGEKIAAAALESKGYESYLPVYRRKVRWSDRTVETDKTLFPGYVFCRFDAKHRLPIITTPSVVSVVGFGSEPAAIPDREIEAIQTVLHGGVTAQPCPFLRDGQRVRVNRGSLQGLEGILLKTKGDYRLVISVEMLTRSVSVEIDRDWIAAAA